jgi:hypothetical protein
VFSLVRKHVSDSFPVSGSLHIKVILKEQSDFNVALDLIALSLRGLEPWRFRRAAVFSISEILALKVYHVSIWGESVE